MQQLSEKQVIDRFRNGYGDLYEPEPNTGCWLWMRGARSDRRQMRYGTSWINGKPIAAHRLSWRAFRGDISPGMVVMHTCDTPLCVNPDHLVLGTVKDNNRDRERKHRGAWQRNGMPSAIDRNVNKLVPHQVLEIRRRLEKGGVSQREIADIYGVHPSVISDIKRRKLWSWVK